MRAREQDIERVEVREAHRKILAELDAREPLDHDFDEEDEDDDEVIF